MNRKKNQIIPPSGRAAALTAARTLKMAASTQAYVRGSTVKFYDWISHARSGLIPEGPAIWICGDCHIGNIGPIADAANHVAIEIRDLDQTVIGNPSHDLIRLALSLAMSARVSNLSGVTTARMLEQLMVGYENIYRPRQSEHTKAEKVRPIKGVLKQALARRWKQLANERIGGVSPTIPLGARFWPLAKQEKKQITELFSSKGLDELKTSLHPEGANKSLVVLDAAYWMKGCSSLGLLRYAVLVKFDDDQNQKLYLIDIKEAGSAAAPRNAEIKMPPNNAKRVVEGALHLAPHLGKRMVASRLMDRSIFIRELMPQDLKIEIGKLDPNAALDTARFLGQVIGKAHARQMDAAMQRSWQQELIKNHSKDLEAPSWLWSSVVELIGVHEQGYLEHCRNYSLTL